MSSMKPEVNMDNATSNVPALRCGTPVDGMLQQPHCFG